MSDENRCNYNSLCPEQIITQDHVETLREGYHGLAKGQELINEAITKLTENMSYLKRLDDRVVIVEAKMNKMIGGLILSSVITPIIVSCIFTAAWYFIGK